MAAARVHNASSNRAKPALERKDVFKSVLDSPFRISWPSIPMSVQTTTLDLILEMFGNVAEYRSSRKRAHKGPDASNKKRKIGEDASAVAGDSSQTDAPPPLENENDRPAILNHMSFGINQVSKRLDAQIRLVRKVTSFPAIQDNRPPLPPLKLILVCRGDIDPHVLIDHFPHQIAAFNAGKPEQPLKMIYLPAGAEARLAVAMGVRRIAVLGLDVDAPGLDKFEKVMNAVDPITAPWLIAALSPAPLQLIPTHVKQMRTTAPKDMKLAKLMRAQGTRCAGKTAVEDYLVSKEFERVRIRLDAEQLSDTSSDVLDDAYEDQVPSRHLSFLSLGPASSTPASARKTRSFASPDALLDYVTRNWRRDWVTVDLTTREAIEMFALRPFVLVLSIDAPLLDRFNRFCASYPQVSLQDFVREDDYVRFGSDAMQDLVNIHVSNSFREVAALHEHLDEVNLLDSGHLRPNWDTYFMKLASLASRRSNCMKRRVGAVIVRENRVVATGYNGTPRGLTNCNEGGCARCNSNSDVQSECVCLHAEENALLEAGRERVGVGSVLYCNTCPCLTCTIKIIQTGVKAVVYNLSYKVDEASARLFAEAGVELRRFQPVKRT
ncbi:Deoxycytidylate deaminase [Mycena kentingensis (nom. inval.)]|nr:Deoxycytidylate deaminase [Mycena kentingensis (nom. inval.)]